MNSFFPAVFFEMILLHKYHLCFIVCDSLHRKSINVRIFLIRIDVRDFYIYDVPVFPFFF